MKEYSVGQVLKNLLIVVLILVGFYFLTLYITENKEENTNLSTNAKIQYEEIRLSSIFNQSAEEYYVLVELEEDISVIYPYVSTLKEASKLNVYTSNLNSVFNESYYAEDSDFSGNKPIFNTTTLIKIKNGIIDETYEGTDIISTYVEELASE